MAGAQDELAAAQERVDALAGAQADLAAAEERLAGVQADEEASISALVDAETALGEAQARVAEATGDATAAAKAFATAQSGAEAAAAKSAEADDAATDAATRLAAAQERATVASQAAADAAVAEAGAQMRAAVAAGEAGDAEEGLAAKTEATTATTEESAGASLTAGAALSKFGMLGSMALAGIGYESIKMATSFQQSMERLVTQAGVPQKELGSLKSGVLAMAGAVGFDPNSLATSLYHVASNMASLGATAPQMLNMVKVAAEGAKVGGANLEDVTNALTASIASGIPGVQNYSQAMGALNSIVGAGDMKMQDLAEAMGSGLMAVVKGYGLSLTDVGAALDTFGDNNIRGAKAATDLRMAVQALAVPAAAGQAQLASMGMSMTTLATTMREHGLLPALEELQAGFKKAGITAAEQGDAITNIFGKKAGVGLSVLMDQMDRLKSKYPAITDGANNFGKAWADTQQTTGQRLDELRATFESLGTAIGTKLLPVISAFAGFLDRNRAVLQALAPIILAIVAAMTAWAAIMKVVDILSDLNPWTLAIMAVIAAAVLLVEHWKQIEAVAKEVFKAVTGAVSDAFDWVKSHWPLLLGILTGPIGAATLFIVDHWKQILNGARSMFDDVVGFFRALPGRIIGALADLGSMMFNAGVHAMESLISGLGSMIGNIGSVMGSVASKIAGFIGLSPAKEGPLSGSGAPEIRGQHIAADIAKGMLSGHSAVASAAQHLAGAAAIGSGSASGGAGTAGGAGGALTLQIMPGGGSGLEQQFWTWFKNGLRVQGGDPRIVNKKIQFL
jgi:TP901 family phage tail tape measure protein